MSNALSSPELNCMSLLIRKHLVLISDIALSVSLKQIVRLKTKFCANALNFICYFFVVTFFVGLKFPKKIVKINSHEN